MPVESMKVTSLRSTTTRSTSPVSTSSNVSISFAHRPTSSSPRHRIAVRSSPSTATIWNPAIMCSFTLADEHRSYPHSSEPRRANGIGDHTADPCPCAVSVLSPTPACSAKSLLEPWIIAYRGEVVVSACVLAELRAQLHRPPQMVERVVAGVARERCEARVVVVQARVVWRVLEGLADSVERVGIPLFAVGGHRRAVVLPGVAPIEPLIRLAGCGADHQHGSLTGHLPPRLRPHEHERSALRLDRLAVDLERRLAIEHDVQLLLARPGLVVLIDQRAVLTGREGVDPERVDPELLAHRDVPAAPLDVVDVRDLPVGLVVHPITSRIASTHSSPC